jgi:hypothetical protein
MVKEANLQPYKCGPYKLMLKTIFSFFKKRKKKGSTLTWKLTKVGFE